MSNFYYLLDLFIRSHSAADKFTYLCCPFSPSRLALHTDHHYPHAPYRKVVPPTTVIGSSHPVSLPTAVSASTLDLGKDEAEDLPRPSWLKYDYDRAEKKKNSKPLSYR